MACGGLRVNQDVNRKEMGTAVSISVVCYRYKRLANGESPLMLRVSKDGKRSMRSLGVSVDAKQWDFRKNEPKLRCPNREYILDIILKAKLEYEGRAMKKQAENEEFTADSFLSEKSKQARPMQTVETFYQNLISELRAAGKIGNSYAYLNSYNSLKAFNEGKRLSYMFSAVNAEFLQEYEAWLRQRGCRETTLSYLFRTLRSAYNKAVAQKVAKAGHSPFDEFKVGKFNTNTVKRALRKEDVLRILSVDTRQGTALCRLAQDVFAFSYLCAGMSFVDIANLTQANIQDGALVYERQKTHRLVHIPLSDEAKAIIVRYDEHCQRAGYLFPILDKYRHVSPMQKNNRVRKVCHQVNQELRRIASKAGIHSEVTTYVARHSFATVLKRSGVNISLISEALGHADLATTQIYLARFEDSQVADAMKHLL